METQSGAQSARGEATRRVIRSTAAGLFVEQGFGAVSLRDIAARAQISHPGILRHYASKDEILDAVVDELERENLEWLGTTTPSLSTIPALARRNESVPGYVSLFTTLAGEATSSLHPANNRFTNRHRGAINFWAERFRSELGDSQQTEPSCESAHDCAVRLVAVWDGLQLLSLYLPNRVSVPESLEHYLGSIGVDASGSVQAATSTDNNEIFSKRATSPQLAHEPLVGYAQGRARRNQIVTDSAVLFAQRGFHATSLAEIAQRVGISKSTLLHHFGSKDRLLAAVIDHWDSITGEQAGDTGDDVTDLTTLLARYPDAQRDALARPGLIELYAVLSAEASSPSHPAHEYFRNRFVSAIGRFTALFSAAIASGDAIPGLDPNAEAIRLIALLDGLQLQWLYEHSAVDPTTQLIAHVTALMSTPLGNNSPH
ncbi:TetR/AcrR family transcriptional regulator [Lysinibacter cavernae]|uniref:AcrR family transcriptional regulator n=1 Tax=Lysinibacter cavernae TaxID=1640652 RepID=A0A7X5TVH5_9MICO|nr:TetR/AcrR family transcriptional regulator [Lysinibacter cavernae]NIH55297.1 AcrR family transcriptional regulator [Lysinibacter cavernae]